MCGSEFAVLRSKRAAVPTGDRPEESVSEEYVAHQKAHFSATEDERFLWQTTHPLVRGRELAVLEPVLEGKPATVLEVGCGEGANIETLKEHGRGVRFTGVDYSHERVAFCRRQHPEAQFHCADATSLPFADNTFDSVFCRDLLHHMVDKEQAVREMLRVCRPGGAVSLIEANGRNPIMWLYGRFVRVEADIMNCSMELFRGLVPSAHCAKVEARGSLPFPLERVVCHYKFGFPGLADVGPVRRLLTGLDELARRHVPQNRWGYAVIRAVKGEPSAAALGANGAGPIRVSVIIPAFNAGAEIGQCLTALAASSVKAHEIIVADDGSSDDTVAVAERCGATVVRAPRNEGASAARNRGAAAATGDVLLFIDADVVVAPDAIARTARVLEERPEVTALVGTFDEHTPIPGFPSDYKNLYVCHGWGLMPPYIGATNTSITAVRRAAFDEAGGFDAKVPTSEDDRFGAELVARGATIWLDQGVRIQHLKRYTMATLLRDSYVKSKYLACSYVWHWLDPDRRNGRFGHHSPVLMASLVAAYLVLVAGVMAVLWPQRATLSVAALTLGLYALLHARTWGFYARRRGLWFTAQAAGTGWLELVVSGVAVAGGVFKALTTRQRGQRGQP